MGSVSTIQVNDETRVTTDDYIIQASPGRIIVWKKKMFKNELIFDSAGREGKK